MILSIVGGGISPLSQTLAHSPPDTTVGKNWLLEGVRVYFTHHETSVAGHLGLKDWHSDILPGELLLVII